MTGGGAAPPGTCLLGRVAAAAASGTTFPGAASLALEVAGLDDDAACGAGCPNTAAWAWEAADLEVPGDLAAGTDAAEDADWALEFGGDATPSADVAGDAARTLEVDLEAFSGIDPDASASLRACCAGDLTVSGTCNDSGTLLNVSAAAGFPFTGGAEASAALPGTLCCPREASVSGGNSCVPSITVVLAGSEDEVLWFGPFWNRRLCTDAASELGILVLSLLLYTPGFETSPLRLVEACTDSHVAPLGSGTSKGLTAGSGCGG